MKNIFDREGKFNCVSWKEITVLDRERGGGCISAFWRRRGSVLFNETAAFDSKEPRSSSGFFTYLKGKNISCSGTFLQTYIIYQSYFSREPPKTLRHVTADEQNFPPLTYFVRQPLENARRTFTHGEGGNEAIYQNRNESSSRGTFSRRCNERSAGTFIFN